MVISNTNTKSIYNCNGTTRNFNLGFVFDENVSSVGILVKHSDGTTEQIEENYEIVEGVLTYPTVESELDPLPEGDKLIIERFTPLTQTINLTQQGPLDAETLEGGYDKNTLISQELQEQIGRAIKFPVTEDGETDAQEYINDLQDLVTEATTQAGIATTKAGEAATSATAADTAKTTAQKWAEGTDAQVEELGGTHSAKGWADYTEDVIENSGIDQLVDVIDDIQTVAGISSDVSQVASISAAVSTVSGHDSEVTLVADNMASVMTTANSITDVQNVASDITNINTVAGISSDVTTVSTNATAIATAATNMAAIIAAPTAATNAANSAAEAQIWAEGTDGQVSPLGGEHSAKGWAAISKQYAETIGAALKYKGSVSTYSALPSTGQEVGDMWNVLDTGKNYAWTGTEWDDLSGVVDLSAYRTAAAQDVIDATKQDTLVSGTNIKTVNSNSLLGSGNIDIDALPSQTGQSGKYLTTNGTSASWGNVDALKNLNSYSSSLTILGSATPKARVVQIGKNSYASEQDNTVVGYQSGAQNEQNVVVGSQCVTNTAKGAVAVGYLNQATGNYSISIGRLTKATAENAIQLGSNGSSITTNSTAKTLQVFEYQLLDGNTGKIPAARLPSVAPELDNKSVNLNSDSELQTVGVIDQNNTSNAIKTWTGTKAEYDAIVTKDANTFYTTTDETDSSTSYTTTELSAMGLPDWDRYEILTVGPSTTSYTAPANGWFFANGKMSGNSTGNINLRLANTTNYMARAISWATGNVANVYFPAKQGDEIVFGYSPVAESLALIFVYAKGNPGGN